MADRARERGSSICVSPLFRVVVDWVVGRNPLAVHVAVSPEHGTAGKALSTGVTDVGFVASV